MPLVVSGSQNVLFSKFAESTTKPNWFDCARAKCGDQTKCPVPVRLSALVSTSLLKGNFEVFEVRTMPGNKVASVVDLYLC